MSDLVLYTNPWSRGRVVRWMLEEIGAPYQVNVLDYGTSIKAPEYLAINPMGKVPALRHGEVIVTEVAAILAYLADCFPDSQLAPPAGSPLRGTFYRWLFFMAGPFEMATSAKAYGWRIDEDNVQAVGCGYVEDTINTLAQALQPGPYLCGEQFTAADILVSSYLWWEMDQKHLEPRPEFQEYVSRTGSRPAAQRANELDDALVKMPEPG